MGSQPINRRPLKPAQKGQPPTLEWARWVESTLRRLIDVPPPKQRPITGGSAEKPPFWAEISTVPESDPPEYQATFTLGFLTYQNAGASESEQGVTGYIVPKIKNEDGEFISMDAEAPIVVPAVPLPDVVSFVYLRVKTDADGVPKFDNESVTIEAFDEAQESIHHVRPSPSGGEEEGDYYFLLLETESNGATPTPAPRVVRRLTGNREMPNQLIEITNIGGKRELYQGYLPGPDDKHELRTLEQLEGDGEPVLKDLNPGNPEAIPPVPAEEEGPTIKFRRVAQRATRPQITIKDGGDVIRVEGNDFSSGTGGFAALLNHDDGLATSVLDVPFGYEGQVSIVDGCGTLIHQMGFEKGLLVTYSLEAIP